MPLERRTNTGSACLLACLQAGPTHKESRIHFEHTEEIANVQESVDETGLVPSLVSCVCASQAYYLARVEGEAWWSTNSYNEALRLKR